MLNRLRASEDDGFTLVELLVVMLITGIVLAMVGTMFANIARITSWSGRDRDDSGQSALALDAIRAVVRVAADNPSSPTTTDPAVLDAKNSSLTLTSYSYSDILSTAPVKVTFALDTSGYLVQTRYPAFKSGDYWAFSTVGSSTRIAGPFAISSPATPFFTYISTTNAVLTGGTSGLTLDQRKTVTLIRVTATTNGTDSSGASDSGVVTSSIGMPNLTRDVVSSFTIPVIPVPTQTPTLTPTPSKSATSVPTATATSGSPSASPTPSGSGSGNGSGTGTGNGTATPHPTGSGGSGTAQPTGGSGGGTSTPKPSSTPTPTVTKSSTPTPTPSATTTKPIVFQ